MNLFVLAGTEDGRKLAAVFQKRGHDVLVSTLTEYGAEIAEKQGLKARSGALNEDELKAVCKEREIQALIDATHPYAENIRSLALRVCREEKIPYFRWERPQGEYPEHPLIHYVKNIKAAAECSCRLGKRVFLSTGSKNLKEWLECPEMQKCEVFVRVLPTAQVIKQCEEVGLKPYQIIAAQGPFTQKFNEALWEQLKIDVVITKESGPIGGTHEKVKACLALGIPVIIMERPADKGSMISIERPEESTMSQEDFVRKVEKDLENRNYSLGTWQSPQ